MEIFRMIFLSLLFLLISLILVCYVIYVIDQCITSKRIEENQKAWDEYSKGMSIEEKIKIFPEWLLERKQKKGWKYLYIPKM